MYSQLMQEKNWVDTLKNSLEDSGIEHFGLRPLAKPISIEFYKSWIQQNLHAGMNYLDEHIEKKENPKLLLPSANTVISLAVPYIPHPRPLKLPFKALKVAAYARGEDYHHWLLARLQKVCDLLKQQYPSDEFLCFTDSKPFLEKEWGSQNGLGWIGKNSLLLNKKIGSYFFLGEILTTLKSPQELTVAPPVDHCGKCSACVEACPTDAILDNRSIDAGKCIAYLNIESKEVPAQSLRSQYNSWLFGCDICQQVCPWNQKILQAHPENHSATVKDLAEELTYILTSSNKKLQRDLKGTPLTRAGGNGLKRSALAIIGGARLNSLKPLLEETHFENPDLKEMKDWALSRLV